MRPMVEFACEPKNSHSNISHLCTVQVCMDQNCHANVFLLSCNIMDRFLSQLTIKKSQFQVGKKKTRESC